MSVEVRSDYSNGYVVEILKDNNTLPCSSWVLLPAENLWSPILRGFLYVICLFYFFIGIAIASDIFMSSIEVITSKKRTIVRWDKAKNTKIELEVLVWNETVANLTLMALGSSAPEILLAVLETLVDIISGDIGEPQDSLGTFTIIGSAAFNLLVITSICIISVPPPEPKKIREFSVFVMTSAWSFWAYIWLLLVVQYITPDVIDPWEAWITLAFMPIFVFLSYCQHNSWWCKKAKVDQAEDDVSILLIVYAVLL